MCDNCKIWRAIALTAIALVWVAVIFGCTVLPNGLWGDGQDGGGDRRMPTPTAPDPVGDGVKGELPHTPAGSWYDDPNLWAVVMSTVGIVGHRIYSQRKGGYARNGKG